MPPKCIGLLLPFSLFLMGCLTESFITREEFVPDDCQVFFYLQEALTSSHSPEIIIAWTRVIKLLSV
jgi:hypothetical protein